MRGADHRAAAAADGDDRRDRLAARKSAVEPFNIALTILIALLLAWMVPELVKFLLIDAVWTGTDRDACREIVQHREIGACWPFVWERWSYFIYGSYPIPERWRVDVFFALLAIGVVWMLWLDAPRRDLGAVYFFVVMPISSFILLDRLARDRLAAGRHRAVGRRAGDHRGGLGRHRLSRCRSAFCWRSAAARACPRCELFSVIFIEFVRGVPLVTVLFMASVMLPLFVPEWLSPDKLVRALVGIALFASAYMAEVVRAGLQAIPKGQYEGAMAVGLRYWQMMRLIILPQALKITIPNIVNTYIGLFKDTTLVFIVGIFDLLRTIEVARIDPKWATPVTSTTGYAVAAMFYLIFCYGMSRYAHAMEARLAKGDRR